MPIKVFVVDDSLFMRRIIADSIKNMEGIELLDTAQNGFFALTKLKKINPDIISLDIEMPVMDGLKTIQEIRKESDIPIIMLSASDDQETTIHALEIGAQDFITKPENINENKKEFTENLESHIKALVKSGEKKESKKEKKELKRLDKKIKNQHTKQPDHVDVLMIGASTGGPKVVTEIVKQLPKDLSIPVFIVQHMPKGFTSSFAQRMNTLAEIPVVEAEHRMRYQAGTVYLAPGGKHMVVRNKRIMLLDTEKIHSVKPAVDPLFKSLVQLYGKKTLAIILTGMGKDGAEGALAVKDAGGYVLAQNEESCVVYGMPRYACEAGAVHELLPIEEITKTIKKIVEG